MHERRTSSGNASLGDLVFGITRRLRRMSAQASEPFGLSPHQLRALHVIDHEQASRPSTLAERLRVTPRSATDVVDGLEAKGLVDRSPDPGDRRAVLVQLTDQGRTVLAQADEARAALHHEWFGVLSDADQHQLRALLTTLDERHSDDAC